MGIGLALCIGQTEANVVILQVVYRRNETQGRVCLVGHIDRRGADLGLCAHQFGRHKLCICSTGGNVNAQRGVVIFFGVPARKYIVVLCRIVFINFLDELVITLRFIADRKSLRSRSVLGNVAVIVINDIRCSICAGGRCLDPQVKNRVNAHYQCQHKHNSKHITDFLLHMKNPFHAEFRFW